MSGLYVRITFKLDKNASNSHPSQSIFNILTSISVDKWSVSFLFLWRLFFLRSSCIFCDFTYACTLLSTVVAFTLIPLANPSHVSLSISLSLSNDTYAVGDGPILYGLIFIFSFFVETIFSNTVTALSKPFIYVDLSNCFVWEDTGSNDNTV